MKREEILLRLNEIDKITEYFGLIRHLDESINNITNTCNMASNHSLYKEGISVIIPTYKGEKYISRCLESLCKQTLKKELFEIIIVINGTRDSTEIIINDLINIYNLNNIRVLYIDKANASLARNKGIMYAERRYTLFIDDDDYISENYLEEMYAYSNNNHIIISQIVDVDENGYVNEDNPINKQIKNYKEIGSNALNSLSMVLTINACKLIPTYYIKKIRYDSDLKSGEDVVFFTELITRNNFNFLVIPINKNAIYYRTLRKNSISRQEMSFEFNVIQRLEVIKRLDILLRFVHEDIDKKKLIMQKIRAQSSFIIKYIKYNKREIIRVLKLIKKYKLTYMPYSLINNGFADKLVISYCFPPYMDTSGNVMAKRIISMNEIVDVVYNKMDNVRDKDMTLYSIINPLIDKRIEVPCATTFSNWKAIEEFCRLAISKIGNKKYKKIYSRAMWPASHFFAYTYKIKHPEVIWVAEFSDPILLDIYGNRRESKIDNQAFLKKANKLIKKKYDIDYISDNNLFLWCELLPYIFADEVIFTNINQLKYMKDYFPIKNMKEIIESKSKICPHPTLELEYYHICKSQLILDSEKVNLAYFGNLYQTRKLDILFDALYKLDHKLRQYLSLYIFTSDPLSLKEELKGYGLEQYITVNSSVSFLEFLNLTTIFDCLIVNDAKTNIKKAINPYLPSKLSDYIGSGTDIWGIFEKGSILSQYPLTYKSEIDNIQEATYILEKIVLKKFNMKL